MCVPKLERPRIVVTGANGFVGAATVRRFVQDGHQVWACGRGKIDRGACIIPKRFNELTELDLPAFDALVHLAAANNTLETNLADLYRVNVEDSVRLFEHASARGCKAIVYASSIHVYGQAPAPLSVYRTPAQPVSAYGRSKLALEHAAAAFSLRTGIPVVGLRLANVYGPGERHKGTMASQVTQLADQMLLGDPVLYAPGKQIRDFVHVEDVAQAFHQAIFFALAGQDGVLNCGSGSAVAFNDLVAELNNAMGLQRRARYIPEPAGYLGEVILDIDQTKQKLAWQPRDLRQGLRDYLAAGQLPTP